MSAGPSPYLRRRGHAHDRRLLAEDALRVLGEPTERVHDVKIRAKKIREQIGSPRAVADVLRLGLRMFSEELRGVDDVLRDSVPLAPARATPRPPLTGGERLCATLCATPGDHVAHWQSSGSA